MQMNIPSLARRPAYTATIFDFEGTLVDFQWQLESGEHELRRAFAKLGFDGDVFANGNYATMWNAAARQYVREGRMAELRQRLFPIYTRWDFDALSRWSPRRGAEQLLYRLVAAGMRLGMVSNVGREALSTALTRFNFAGSLSPVVSRDDVTYMKPDAEGIVRLLSKWQLAPSDALFVGDSRADVSGARAAGMKVAILRGRECEEAAFAADPPDYMISQLEDLIDILDGR